MSAKPAFGFAHRLRRAFHECRGRWATPATNQRSYIPDHMEINLTVTLARHRSSGASRSWAGMWQLNVFVT